MRREGKMMGIEQIVRSIDKWARVIPGRFARCRTKQETMEVIYNPRNKRELFLKMKVKTLLQKIKIECSTVGLAERIRMELNNQ
jgi:hypothetical protein